MDFEVDPLSLMIGLEVAYIYVNFAGVASTRKMMQRQLWCRF